MKWSDTVASQCRYGNIAERIWGDWDILWEDSRDDYQGHALFLATHKGRFCYYGWEYGSCSGCDTWECAEMSEQEMREFAMWLMSVRSLARWIEMLKSVSRAKEFETVPVLLDASPPGRLESLERIVAQFVSPTPS